MSLLWVDGMLNVGYPLPRKDASPRWNYGLRCPGRYGEQQSVGLRGLMCADTAHHSDPCTFWRMTVSCLLDNISRLAPVLSVLCPVDVAWRTPRHHTDLGKIWAGSTSCRKNLVSQNFPESTQCGFGGWCESLGTRNLLGAPWCLQARNSPIYFFFILAQVQAVWCGAGG